MGRDAKLLLGLFVLLLAGAGAWYFLRQAGEAGDDLDAGPHAPPVAESGPGPNAPRRDKTPPLAATPTTAPVVVGAEANAGGPADPRDAGRLLGRVVDPDRKPIEKAFVSICEDVADNAAVPMQGPIVVAQETAADGAFDIRGLLPGKRYILRADHQNFASTFLTPVETTRGENRVLEVMLKVGVDLSGEVVDDAGRAVEGALVFCRDQGRHAADPDLEMERKTNTDAEGKFTLTSLAIGYKHVMASKEGFATAVNVGTFVGMGAEAPPLLKLVLKPGQAIAGICRDQDGQPVEGAVITLRGMLAPATFDPKTSMAQLNNTYPSVKSDKLGLWRQNGVLPGRYDIFCLRAGYSGGIGANKTNVESGNEQVELVMTRNPRVKGKVVDASSGDPIVEFDVVVSASKELWGTTPRTTQHVNSLLGEFEYLLPDQNFAALPGERYLFAVARNYAPSRSDPLILKVGQDLDGVIIKMAAGATGKGRVVDGNGKGIGGASVEVSARNEAVQGPAAGFLGRIMRSAQRPVSQTAITDAEGNFVVKNLAEGLYSIRATHENYSLTEQDPSERVPASGEVSFGSITMMKGATLSGTVLDDKKAPYPGGSVQLISKGQLGGGYNVTADATGKYLIKNITPGVYIIRRGSDPNKPTDIFGPLMKPGRELLLGDGEEAVQDVD